MTNENEQFPHPETMKEAQSSYSIESKYLSIDLPADMIIWRQAHKLIETTGAYSEEFATCIAQDPILVLELVKDSQVNLDSYSSKNLIQNAVKNLGVNKTKDILEDVILHPTFDDDEVQHLFNLIRHRGRRTSIVAKILGEVLANSLSDNCLLVALFSSLDQMLALATLGKDYIKIINEAGNNQEQINKKVSQQFKLIPNIYRIIYLQTHNITADIISVYDEKAQPPSRDFTIIKPICLAAMELVNYFDSDNWDALAPDTELPANSALRQLKITPSQYAKIFSRITTYLQSTINLPTIKDLNLSSDSISVAQGSIDISSHISDKAEATNIASSKEEEPQFTRAQQIERLSGINFQNKINEPNEEKQEIQEESSELKPPLRFYLQTDKGHKFVEELNNMFNCIDNTADMLTYLLEKLTNNGPFTRSALIVISENRRYAVVVAARGDNIRNGQKLLLDDPLSPLAQCFSKILSFGTKPSKNSPFGSKTYALAPIKANHSTPVALYADCGDKGSISFESRRVFRTTVELLNQYLPKLKGAIPNELNSKK